MEYLHEVLTDGSSFNSQLGGNVYWDVTEGMLCINIRNICSCMRRLLIWLCEIAIHW